MRETILQEPFIIDRKNKKIGTSSDLAEVGPLYLTFPLGGVSYGEKRTSSKAKLKIKTYKTDVEYSI